MTGILIAGVEAVDCGIRGVDLMYALVDGYPAVVLVDAVQRGGEAGIVYVIQPDWLSSEEAAPAELRITPHDLDPAKVLRLVKALDGHCERLVRVGCEPGTLGTEDEGAMGLSAPVAAAVDEAVPAIEVLIGELFGEERPARNATVKEGDHDIGGPR